MSILSEKYQARLILHLKTKPVDAAQTHASFDVDQHVFDIYTSRKPPPRIKDIAEEFGVSPTNIHTRLTRYMKRIGRVVPLRHLQ